MSKPSHLPMRRNIPQPRNAGGFEGHSGVQATGDGAVDDGLLLFVEERNDFALGADGALQPPASPLKEAHDGGLLGGRGEGDVYHLKMLRP